MPAVVGCLWGTDVFQNRLRALARDVLSCGIAPQLRHWIQKPAEWMVVVARQFVAEPLKLYPVFRRRYEHATNFRRRSRVYNPLSCVPFRRAICRNIYLSSSETGDFDLRGGQAGLGMLRPTRASTVGRRPGMTVRREEGMAAGGRTGRSGQIVLRN